MIQKQKFDIYQYPRDVSSKPIGRLEFWDGTPIAKMPAGEGLRLAEYFAGKERVWVPKSKSYVPVDWMNKEHVTLLCSTLPCIGYQADIAGDEQAVGKDREFEEKHPREEGGKFAHKSEQTETPVDVRREFQQAMRQAPKFKQSSDKLKVMAAILHSRGGDRAPHIESETQIQNRVANGERELWRGVEEPRYATMFKGGPLRLGTGIMGSGVYIAFGKEGRQYASGYTGQGRGALLHMTLDKDAKVGDWQTVANEMAREGKSLFNTPDGRCFFSDVGLYGAAKGYDALISERLGMGLLLNRNKVRVARENAIEKSLTAGDAGLSRRVARSMDTERMMVLTQEPEVYAKFVEAIHAAERFADLPEWVQEEIAEAELEQITPR